MQRMFLIMAICLVNGAASLGQESYLYKTSLVRATPGKLLDLIEAYGKQGVQLSRSGDEAPFLMRHSQGDQWDLLLLYPIATYQSYYQEDRIERRAAVHNKIMQSFEQMIAWQSDLYVTGPELPIVRRAFSNAGFFHVEIFKALPGKQKELYKQRVMENAYLKALKRPQNLIFVRDQGAEWDLYTVGFYRDIKHFAESADIPEALEQSAALSAGFAGADRIGTYLRTLIQEHHDTLAGSVK